MGLDCLDIIRESLGVQLPQDEAGFWAIFFSDGLVQQGCAQVPTVIVVAHGPSTATSMADTVNRLLGGDIVIGFDASLDESPLFSAKKEYLFLSFSFLTGHRTTCIILAVT